MTVYLNTNENPYLPDEKILQAAMKGLDDINKYPELSDINELKKLLSKYNADFPCEQIILSHGSDLLIREIINIFSKDRKIMMVNPSFFSVSKYALERAGKLTKFQISPPHFTLDAEFLLNKLNEPALLLIENPNNPTGKAVLNYNLVEEILQNKNTLMLVDEAYFEFSGQTFAGLLNKYSNLVITRTMDKAFSLAGLRLGYLMAGDYFKDYFSDYPQLLSKPAVFAAIESLKNIGLMKQIVAKIIDERERVSKKLTELGFEVFPSETNFLLIKSKIHELALKLKNKKILIYDLSSIYSNDFYRITIGNSNENDNLLNTIMDDFK
ncbi:MAG: aminotransferase class I/II-fold pyridoxal phosphate-dependent enzyme [Ignavibacteria bacterium]|nr:aminotransferase class I/II-fold pyridoxal phosphate-dependent enzyme [Ignavibacteria bacterium]